MFKREFMSQTILIEDNKDIEKIFTINLTTYTGTDVISMKSGADCLELLQILPSIDLIITRPSVDSENTLNDIVTYQTDKGLSIPIVCLGTPTIEDKRVVEMSGPIRWEELVKQSAKLLGISLAELQERISPQYQAVPIKYFYEIYNVPCDVYIKIKKSHSEFQYVKRINTNDQFTHWDIERYEHKGLSEFFVPRDYAQYFSTFITNKLITKLEESNIPTEERITTTANSYDMVSDQITEHGLDEVTIELANASINSLIQSVKESPKLNELIKFLFTSKISYAYQRCHMTAVIGTFILKRLKLDNHETLEIFNFMSFFSNITLKSQDQLDINSNEGLDNSSLDDKDKAAVESHAYDASKIIDDFPAANLKLTSLIRSQHGNLDGHGFNPYPNENFDIIVKIYMIADEYARIILNPGEVSSKKDVLDYLIQKFVAHNGVTGEFGRIVACLKGKIE
jgi:hypothetical protein